MTIKNFSTSKKRIRNRGKKLTSTIIEFRLSEPARLVFVFRGPGPSCKVSARIPAVGLAGLNRFRFHGYIGKRPLKAGTYLLVLRARQSSKSLAQTHLSIVNPTRRAKHVRPDCHQEVAPIDLASVLAPAPFLGALVGDVLSAIPTPANGGTAKPGKAAAPQSGEPQSGDTLGEQAEESAGVPNVPSLSDATESAGWIELILAPALLALTFAALAVLATRRRPPPEAGA